MSAAIYDEPLPFAAHARSQSAQDLELYPPSQHVERRNGMENGGNHMRRHNRQSSTESE